jgi:formylglycine-generating enzyme required for sulfatase activity
LPAYYELTGSAGTPGTASWLNPSLVSTLASGINSYRLPSEAEQQRARRGSEASTASNATYAPAGTGLGSLAWYSENSGNKTHSVGRLLPTSEGVHDALGNVYEWGNGWYAEQDR